MKTKEYRAIAEKIKSTNDANGLLRLEKLATRIYDAGLLNPIELGKLDTLIMEKIATL
jgi:hypothetical protein